MTAGKCQTRADDERILRWLQLRCQGLTSVQIARREGVTANVVRTATNRVRAADLEGTDVYGWNA